MNTISINIAKANYILFDSLRSALTKFKDLRILGEYNSYNEAVQGLYNQVPDVLLLNIQIDTDLEESLNQETGLELLEHLSKENINTKVIILSNTKRKSVIDIVRRYKVAGYLLTNVSINVLKIAIDEVASGKTFFPREIRALFDEQLTDNILQLSSREQEVLKLVSTGHSTLMIALKLNLHKDTVSDYRESLMKKFGAKNAPNLVRLAYERRFL